MILKKLEELENLIIVPDVNKEPEQSITSMKMLNLIVELRGLVKNCNLQNVIASTSFRNDLIKAIKEGYEDIIIIGKNELKTFNMTVALMHIIDVFQKYSL